MQERAPNSSCTCALRGTTPAAPPPDHVLRSASDGVRRAPQSVCEGDERPGLAFGRGDDRSSTAWCAHALCAALSLRHPRAREACSGPIPSCRSRARPDMCTTVTSAPPVAPATPPPAQTACTSRGSRERARTMSDINANRWRCARRSCRSIGGRNAPRAAWSAPIAASTTSSPAQTSSGSRGSRERARTMSAVRTSRFRYNSWPGSSFYGQRARLWRTLLSCLGNAEMGRQRARLWRTLLSCLGKRDSRTSHAK